MHTTKARAIGSGVSHAPLLLLYGRNWVYANAGRCAPQFQVSALFRKARSKATAVGNAVNFRAHSGVCVCGQLTEM